MLGARLIGVNSAITTPFKQNEELDEEALREEIRYQIRAGINGVVVNSTPGEISSLTIEERKRICEIAVEEVKDRAAIITDVGTPRTTWSIELAKHAEKVGTNFVMALTPWLLPQTDETIYNYYASLARELTEAPLILYNLPKYAGYNIPPELFRRLLSEYPDKIAGIKDTSGSIEKLRTYISAAQGKASVVVGDDKLLYPALNVGANGCISAMAACFPNLAVNMYEAFLVKDFKTAESIQKKFDAVKDIFHRFPYLGAQKGVQELQGRKSGFPRAPLRALTPVEKEELKAALTQLGLL